MEEQPTNETAAAVITPATLARFLIGGREAITAIASSRAALGVGALFCLSAGFAREYDGEDLAHEPWHVAIPILVSLITSFVLYAMLYFVARKRSGERPRFLAGYLGFLCLYWMTAPLAWMYAVPFEQWLAPVDAMRANLTLLGIVSVWRVLLIIRCASVLLGAPVWAATFVVMLFADTLAMVVIGLTPLPIFNIMGGVRLTETERLIQNTALNVQLLGVVTLPIWGIGSIVALWAGSHEWEPILIDGRRDARVSRTLWAVAVATVLVWAAILPNTQPPQRLKRLVDDALADADVATAINLLSRHQRSDFPPSWDPEPRPGFGQNEPPLSLVLAEAVKARAPEWVVDLYLDKLEQETSDQWVGAYYWRNLTDEQLDRYASVAESLPDLKERLTTIQEGIKAALAQEGLSEERRALLLRLSAAVND